VSTDNNIALIARREVTSRLRQKSLRIGLLVTLIVIAVIASVPRFVGGHTQTYDVGVVGSDSAALSTAIQAVGAQQNLKVTVHQGTSAADAAHQVSKGKWAAAVIDDVRIVAKTTDSTAVGLLQAAHQSVTSVQGLRRSGLSNTQISAALNVAALPIRAETSSDSAARQAIATITVVLLFGQLISFCTQAAMGVVEEKSSRVVEIILATVRPWQLLVGKLLGIGVIALGQLVAVGVVGVGVATTIGGVHLPSGALGAIAAAVGWFVLAFAFFSVLAAALASLVSRQEEVGGVLLPMSALLMVSYLVGLAVSNAPDSTLSTVASMVPPISTMAMPALMARGGVSLSHILTAVTLMLVVTALMLALGAKIYRAAVLHSGSKVSLRTAWRGEAAADLD
jgi:ABC-2 type transport system permease protein